MATFPIFLGVSLEETLGACKEKLTTAPEIAVQLLILTYIRCGLSGMCVNCI